MKTKDKKTIYRGIALFAVLVVVFYFLNEMSRLGVYSERYEIINHADYIQEDSVDIIIIGNSHAQQGLNGSLMSDILEANVLNFSLTQQQTATAYYFLKKNLKQQSPEVVVLEAYTLIQQVQRGYNLIPLSPAKIKYYTMMKDEGYFMECFFPIADYHNFWANETPLSDLIHNITTGEDEPEVPTSMAIMSDTAVKRHETYESRGFVKEIFEYRFENLKEIYELCEENGAELIITMLPLYGTLVENIDYNGLYYDKIKNFCMEYGISYYDFNLESETEWSYKYFQEQDYTHNNHLNAYGQTLATIELSEFLANATTYYSLSEYSIPELPIIDFISSVDESNSLLIVDDCPKTINSDINAELAGLLDSYGISLRKDRGEGEAYAAYLVTGGSVVEGYTLPDDFYYAQYGITLCEIDSAGNIKKRAVARWDEFTTAVVRN